MRWAAVDAAGAGGLTQGRRSLLAGRRHVDVEALPEPAQYRSELDHLGEADRRRILVDNTAELNERRPA